MLLGGTDRDTLIDGDRSRAADSDILDGREGGAVVSYAARTAPVNVDLVDPGPDGETGEGDVLRWSTTRSAAPPTMSFAAPRITTPSKAAAGTIISTAATATTTSTEDAIAIASPAAGATTVLAEVGGPTSCSAVMARTNSMAVRDRIACEQGPVTTSWAGHGVLRTRI